MSLALAGALLVICLYAAFAHGAVAPGDEERLELAIAAIALVAVTAWTARRSPWLRVPRSVWAGVALLAAFAIWCGVTLAWSVAPDQTWIECNRAIAYVLVLVLAIALGASHPRAPRLVADGFALVALVVTVYALGQKLLPGLRLGGLLDLNRTGQLPRLQDPLGYWNALGLFVAIGVLAMLSVVIDARRHHRLRLGAGAAVVAMLVTIAFTYSRGALLALAIALVVLVAVTGNRLRSLVWVGMCVGAALPVAIVGLASAPLTTAGASLGARETAGAELLVLLVADLLLLVLAGGRLLVLEHRVRVRRVHRRAAIRGLTGAFGLAIVAVLITVTLSSRGLGGTASHLWHTFTATRTAGVEEPSRLLSADSENRWVWWKEAAGAFSSRPLGGWGAGSFGVVHLLYRRDTLSVQQPHSVPLQFLAETGVIGALLGLGALATLLGAAVRAVGHCTERGRIAAAALLAGAVAYAVHGCYDWDWDIPAVTIVAFVALGTLAGSLARTRGHEDAPGGSAMRIATGVLAALGVLAFAASAVIPRLAAADAQQALISASGAAPATLRHALNEALSSSRLDPLSDAGLRAAATIAVRQDDPARARRYLGEAIARQPADGENWQQLAELYLALGDRGDALLAARRGLALDPRGTVAIATIQHAELVQAPPGLSATAIAGPAGA